MGGERGPAGEGTGCSRRHRGATRMFLTLGVLWVTAGGFAYPLGLDRLSTWPWNEGWFMFSSDSGWDYHLELEGQREGGTREAIDPSPWFSVQATALGGRFQEIPREREILANLAAYVCAQVNRDTPPGRRISRISVVERAWPRARGRRLQAADVPDAGATRRVWIDRHPCAEAAR